MNFKSEDLILSKSDVVSSDQDSLRLESSWKQRLFNEFQKDYMKNLKSFLKEELKKGKKIAPSPSEIFTALNWTPFDKVKVVILGQDPYHGEGQAHGLSFSVKPGVLLPPSLKNIYKEIEQEFKFSMGKSGFLKPWADQGVLLLNAILTVEIGSAGSHQKKGWEIFTDAIIDILNLEKRNLVFILWGNYALKKGLRIDTKKHRVLQSVHPSPLSASRGFFGCGHFIEANRYLSQNQIEQIDWKIS